MVWTVCGFCPFFVSLGGWVAASRGQLVIIDSIMTVQRLLGAGGDSSAD